MLRLHRDSSRSYPGRPARRGVVGYDTVFMATCRVIGRVSEGHSRRGSKPGRNGKPGKDLPEGGRTQRGRTSMSSYNMMNPHGGVPVRRVMELFNPNENLLMRILSKENMAEAWKRVKANQGTPGVDGISIEQFPEHTRPLWNQIRQSLLTGRYQPSPVRRVEIPKANGGTRPLGIPTVLDRLIQQAIAQILSPIFDPAFSESSFGFRPGRSAHHAVYKVREYIREGCRIAVDVDLSKFFDTVHHDVLMRRVAGKIPDKRVLRLIGKYRRSAQAYTASRNPSGSSSGGPLSPLRPTILDDLDKAKRGQSVCRCDELFIILRKVIGRDRVMGSIKHFLEQTLKLRSTRRKSRVVPTNQVPFSVYIYGTKIHWLEGLP